MSRGHCSTRWNRSRNTALTWRICCAVPSSAVLGITCSFWIFWQIRRSRQSLHCNSCEVWQKKYACSGRTGQRLRFRRGIMIISMLENATDAEIAHVIARVQELGYKPQITRGEEKTIVAAVGSGRRDELEALSAAPGVERLIPIAHPFKLVARQGRSGRTVVSVGDVRIGGDEIVMIAGPCSVESREQLFETAHAV